jgi:hypothetical protein
MPFIRQTLNEKSIILEMMLETWSPDVMTLGQTGNPMFLFLIGHCFIHSIKYQLPLDYCLHLFKYT